jgi:hypothetical protein
MFDPFLHIDDYKEGSLSPDQVQLFEQALKENSELQKIMENYDEAKRLSEGLVEIETRAILESSRKEETVLNKSITRYLLPILAVAAIIAGFILVSQLFQQPVSGETLFAEYFDVPNMAVTKKGTSQDSLLAITQGLFNSKRYPESLTKFDLLDQDKETVLFKGINFLALDQPDNAIKLYDSQSDPTNDIKWYHALAYIQNNNIEKAKEILSQIESSSIHYIKSQDLIKKLSE